MKLIRIIFLILLTLGISQDVKAHQPDLSSTLLVDQGEGRWILQIRASLTAFEYEVESTFGKDAYDTPEAFRLLVSDHVVRHVSILFNDTQKAKLQNGTVKLGHESSITFEILDAPEDLISLDVTNSSFSGISRNRSALMIHKKGFEKKQFNLDNSNDHRAILAVSGTSFIKNSPVIAEKTDYTPLWIGLFLALILLVSYAVAKNRKNYSLIPTL